MKTTDKRAAGEPPAGDDGIGPGEALEYAVGLHRSGKVALAETLYGRILEAAPDYADALHFYGILKHQTGRSLEAIDLIRRAIAVEPDASGMHSNLGNVLLELDRHDLAAKAYAVAIVLDARNTDARNNLGVALRALGRPAEAEALYRETIALKPDHREAWDNLGRLLAASGRVREAIEAHARALELEPGNAQTRRFLVSAYAAIDENERALVILRDWLADEPDSPSARHLLAAISGENVPDRAEDRYVEALFDGFAASFDRKLATLDYRAPALVGAAVAAACGEPDGCRQVLDMGCGTGLCSSFLRPYADRLIGVDLSAKMLDVARGRGHYDDLVRAELTRYLSDHPRTFDLIVSADTLCYFGALGPVLEVTASALKSGGHLVFTVEEATGQAAVTLNHHGRYSHGASHVSDALAAAGLAALRVDRAPLRLERGEPVPGLVVAAQKA